MVKIRFVIPKEHGPVAFDRQDLLKIGAKAIDSITKRTALGLNGNDRQGKPLSKKYRAKKEKLGQPGIRNMMFSGSMLGALTITEATSGKVVIGFTRQAELVKAQKNEQREGWFGLSPNDEAKVMLFADQLLQRKVK